MTTKRLPVAKTYKLFIDGKFPRSESGRALAIDTAAGRVHVCRASRKDLRDAVVAARKAQDGWQTSSAYLRAQILYRAAEMLDARRAEFADAIASAPAARSRRKPAHTPAREVDAAVDRLVAFAGWADKFAQVLGCNNPVSGPYYNFTTPEATGVVAAVAPDSPALLGLVSLIAPPLAAGNTVVALSSETNPLPAVVLGEVLATSDIPPGVVNILTGLREEIVPVIASHRDIDAAHAAGLDDASAGALRLGAAENVKRVTVREVADYFDADECHSPWWIEPFVDMKTVWHPSGA